MGQWSLLLGSLGQALVVFERGEAMSGETEAKFSYGKLIFTTNLVDERDLTPEEKAALEEVAQRVEREIVRRMRAMLVFGSLPPPQAPHWPAGWNGQIFRTDVL